MNINDELEKNISAIVDYIMSYVIKKYNSRNSYNNLIIVAGGKAFSQYIRREYRNESIDWDCYIYTKKTLSVDEIDNIFKS